VDVAHHRLDPQLTGLVAEERHERRDRGQREHERDGHREARHEGTALGLVGRPYGAQHDEGVDEGAEQRAQADLHHPVPHERLQQPR
jgi:hypothetical protein